jgi:hypothetical protein
MRTHLQINIEFDAAIPNAELGLTTEAVVGAISEFLFDSIASVSNEHIRVVSYNSFAEGPTKPAPKKKKKR